MTRSHSKYHIAGAFLPLTNVANCIFLSFFVVFLCVEAKVYAAFDAQFLNLQCTKHISVYNALHSQSKSILYFVEEICLYEQKEKVDAYIRGRCCIADHSQ